MAPSVSIDIFSKSLPVKRIERNLEYSGNSKESLSQLKNALCAAQADANDYLTDLVEADTESKAGGGDNQKDHEDDGKLHSIHPQV